MFRNKKALLLDMNSTFMFGEDRFHGSEDFSIQYRKLGGTLPDDEVNTIIRAVYKFLDIRYSDEKYRHQFPGVSGAISTVTKNGLPTKETNILVNTFAFHELGYIPEGYSRALHKLAQHFILSVVIDIWSPKTAWIDRFKSQGIDKLFSAASFSSDIGIVKPSAIPFEQVSLQLNIPVSECLVIGDNPARDLEGAIAAGIDCVLVGGANDSRAVAHFTNLLTFCDPFS